jgi:hypothetical protein
MATTFALILAPTPDREGLHDVRLRITANRVVRYLNVPGVAVQPKHWNAERSLKKPDYLRMNHPKHADLELSLIDFLDRAQTLGRKQPQATADELKQLLATGADQAEAAPAVSTCFLAFAYKSLEQVDKPSCALRCSTNWPTGGGGVEERSLCPWTNSVSSCWPTTSYTCTAT